MNKRQIREQVVKQSGRYGLVGVRTEDGIRVPDYGADNGADYFIDKALKSLAYNICVRQNMRHRVAVVSSNFPGVQIPELINVKKVSLNGLWLDMTTAEDVLGSMSAGIEEGTPKTWFIVPQYFHNRYSYTAPQYESPPSSAIPISSIAELQLIGVSGSYPLSGYYYLTGNIDASITSSWNGGAGFNPIGAELGAGDVFTGTLDGRGYTISGLVINRPDENYLGLIRHNMGTIKNLTLYGDVTGNNQTLGAITAWNGVSGIGTITNCHSYVNVTAVGGSTPSQGGIGGFTGRCSGNISLCSSHGTVYAPGCMAVGGFDGVSSFVSGSLWYGIQKCYSTGDVTGSLDTGGFAGACAHIKNCYALGSVTTIQGDFGNRGGGFAGACSGTLENCYSNGLVTIDEFGIGGGFLGLDAGATIISCYWDTETSGLETSAGGTGIKTADLADETTFVGWDFNSVWFTTEALARPDLRFPLYNPTALTPNLGVYPIPTIDQAVHVSYWSYTPLTDDVTETWWSQNWPNMIIDLACAEINASELNADRRVIDKMLEDYKLRIISVDIRDEVEHLGSNFR